MAVKTVQLSYAKRLPRRRARLRVALILLTLILGLEGYKNWTTFALRTRAYYWQRQAMKYNPPPTKIVLEGGPQKRLISFDDPADSVVILGDGGRGIPYPRACYPRPGREIAAQISDADVNEWGLAFLHERHIPGGKSRIVLVKVGWGWLSLGCTVGEEEVLVIEPGTLGSAPRILGKPITFHLTPDDPAQNYQIYAGQIDLNDSTHFTVEVATDVHQYIIDGYLDSNDRVSLRARVKRLPRTIGDPAADAALLPAIRNARIGVDEEPKTQPSPQPTAHP